MKNSFLLLSILLAVSSAATAADLVVNGSFESPDIGAATGHIDRTPGSWLTFAPGSYGLPNWQIIGASVSVAHTPYNEGYETVLSGDGTQSADLTGEAFDGLGGLEQVVVTTPGRDYVLTFQLSMYPGSAVYGGPIRVRASAGEITAEFRLVGSVPVPGGLWQAFALPFRAATATTVIRFQNLEAAHWCGLDRVAIAEMDAAGSLPSLVVVSSAIAGGGDAGTSNDRRFSLSGTIGQPDAGLLEASGKHLFGGFWGPGHSMHIALEKEYVRVSWDFGLGFCELQTTTELSNGLATEWTPVSLAGNAGSVLFPVNEARRFFQVREN